MCISLILYAHYVHVKNYLKNKKLVMYIPSFGERFKELRLKINHTQTSIGNELGLKIRIIQYYEKGERYPDYKGLIKIADYFDVSLDYLTGRTDNPDINK